MKSSLFCFAFLICSFQMAFANAADLAGVYVGNGHYGQTTITKRGPDFLIKTCKNFGENCFDVSAILSETAPGKYTSSHGSMTVDYKSSNGQELHCTYPVTLDITQDGNQIYFSEYGPSAVVVEWHSASCPPASKMQYTNMIEDKPYTRK